MRRVLKWVLRAVGGLGVLAAGVLALYVFVVPGIVRRLAVATLEGMGLQDVRLEVSGLSLSRVELTGLAVGREGRLSAGAVGIRYQIPDVLKGKLQSVEVTGFETELRVRDGVMDFGPLGQIKSEGQGAAEFPIGRIDIQSSALLLDIDGQRLRVPFRGSVTNAGGGVAQVDLHVDLEGAALAVTGTVDTNTRAVELKIAGRIEDLSSLAALPRRLGELPARADGSLTFETTLVGREGALNIGASVEGRDLSLGASLAGHQVSADGVAVSIRTLLLLGRDLRLTAIEGGIRAAEVQADGETVRDATFIVESLVEGVAIRAAARGEDWALKKLSGTATGLSGPLGKLKKPILADITWEAEGRVPRRVREMLRAAGIETLAAGQGTASGRAKLRVGGGQKTAWQVDVSEAQAQFGLVDIAVRPLGLQIKGLAGQAQLTARADPSGIRLQIQPKSGVSIKEAAWAEWGAECTAATDQLPFVATLGAPLEVSATFGEDGLAWDARADEVTLSLEGRIDARATGVGVDGLRVTARAKIAASQDSARLEVLPQSRLEVGSVSLERWGVRLAPKSPSEALIVAEVAGEGVAVTLSRGKAGWAWEAKAPEVSFALRPVGAALPSQDMAAGDIAAAGKLRLSADPTKATVVVAPGSGLDVGFLSLGERGVKLAKADATAPLLRVEVSKGVEATLALNGSEPAWRLDAPEVRAALADTDVSLADDQAQVKGLQGVMVFAAKADPRGISLVALEGSNAGVSSAQAALGGEALSVKEAKFGIRGEGDKPLAGLTFGSKGVGFQLAARAESQGPLAAEAGKWAAASLASLGMLVEAGQGAEGVSVRAEIAAEGMGATIDRTLSDTSLKGKVSGGSLHASVEGKGTAWELRKLPMRLDFGLATAEGKEGLRASVAGLEAAAGRLALAGTATVGGAADPVIAAKATLQGGSVSYKEAGLAVSDISVEAPLVLGGKPAPPGKFSLGTIRFGDDQLPGVSGTIGVADWKVQFTAAWPFLKGANLEAEGWLDASFRIPRGEVKAQVPRFEFGDENQPGTLLSSLKGLDFGGAFSMDAQVRMIGSYARPLIHLKLEDGRLDSVAYDATLDGINTEVTINRFSPLSTPGHQRIEVKSARVGKLAVSKGLVDFRLERPDSLFIEQTHWDWAGGTLYTYALSVNPLAPEPDLVVYADHLEVKQLLTLLAQGNATGTGSLYGRLPVTIRWPNIQTGQGFLYATPGTGTLQVSRPLLERIFQTGVSQIDQTAIKTLQDFEYTELKTDFTVEKGGRLARVRVLGRARGNQKARPYLFDLNVTGFDKLLNAAIVVDRASGSLQDRINRR